MQRGHSHRRSAAESGQQESREPAAVPASGQGTGSGGGQEVVAGPGHQGCPGRRRSRYPARRHGRAALPPRRRHARHGAAGQQEVRRRRHLPRPNQGGGKGTGPAKATARTRSASFSAATNSSTCSSTIWNCPTSPSASSPRPRARASAAPAMPPRARPPTFRSAAPSAAHWRGGWRCGGRGGRHRRARGGIGGLRRRARRAELLAEIEALKAKATPDPVHRSDRHPLTAGSRPCRSRSPRPSCSA